MSIDLHHHKEKRGTDKNQRKEKDRNKIKKKNGSFIMHA